jgi:SAM-dependent methyltransferase
MVARTEEGGLPTGRYSYSSMRMGLVARTEEFLQLAKAAVQPVGPGVTITLDTVRTMRERVLEQTGLRLDGLKVLEIGPGQCPQRLRILTTTNDTVGIDTDIVPQGFGEYLKMIRYSPVIRSVKTLGRKMLARDARADWVLAKELKVRKLPALNLVQMSATKMSFSDKSFDFCCSFSVFEHIDDPGAALREVARVLKPGGVAYISIHLYTSHTGQHDPKIFADGGQPIPPVWPHLRPEFEHTVHPSTYLNKVSLDEWRSLFAREMPGTKFLHERDDSAGELAKLRAQGELAKYTDDELTTVNLLGIWKKPQA